MSERRMLSKAIISSSYFLDLPMSVQYLYIYLCLYTDDRGVVEAGTVMRMINANPGDLSVLVSSGYIIPLNDYKVYYVKDFLVHNNLRADRMVESVYRDLLVQVVPDIQLRPITTRADTKKNTKKDVDVHWTSTGRPNISEDKKNKISQSYLHQDYDFESIENRIRRS